LESFKKGKYRYLRYGNKNGQKRLNKGAIWFAGTVGKMEIKGHLTVTIVMPWNMEDNRKGVRPSDYGELERAMTYKTLEVGCEKERGRSMLFNWRLRGGRVSYLSGSLGGTALGKKVSLAGIFGRTVGNGG